MKPREKVKIFYAYSHEDKALRDQLAKHIGRSHISSWHDREIMPGEIWREKTEKELNAAHIILLLISVDFIYSEYCYNIAMQTALTRHAAKEAHVIPIILRPTDYQNEPFSKLQVLPTGGMPVTRWPDLDDALQDVALGVRKVITSSLIKQCIMVAKTYSDQGFYKEALITCEEAINHISSTTNLDYDLALHAILYRAYGDVLQKLKRMEDALEAYDTAISLTTEDAHLYVSKGEILFSLGNFADALMIYNKAISLIYNEPLLHLRRGDVLHKLNRFSDALAAYSAAIKLSPKVADFYKNRGDVLQELKRLDDALADYDTAIRLDPRNATFYVDKESVLFRKKNYGQALATCDEAMCWVPDDARIWRSKGKILSHIAQFEDALVAYEEAIRLEPDSPYLYKEEGDIFLRLGRLEDALAAFEDAVRLDPDFGHAYCSIGTVLDKLAECAHQKLKRRANHAYNRAKQLGIDC